MVAFVIGDDGMVRLHVLRYPTVASLRGAAGSLKQPLSWQEMQQIACEDRFKTKDADFDRFDGITRQEP